MFDPQMGQTMIFQKLNGGFLLYAQFSWGDDLLALNTDETWLKNSMYPLHESWSGIDDEFRDELFDS